MLNCLFIQMCTKKAQLPQNKSIFFVVSVMQEHQKKSEGGENGNVASVNADLFPCWTVLLFVVDCCWLLLFYVHWRFWQRHAWNYTAKRCDGEEMGRGRGRGRFWHLIMWCQVFFPCFLFGIGLLHNVRMSCLLHADLHIFSFSADHKLIWKR